MRKCLPLQLAFRSLIPAWRFFDEDEVAVVLYLKPKGAPESSWVRTDPSHEVRFWNFFYNPQGLSVHAFQSFLKLVQQDPQNDNLLSLLREVSFDAGRRLFPGQDVFDFRIGESSG